MFSRGGKSYEKIISDDLGFPIKEAIVNVPDYNIKFKIKYSLEYKKNNFLKEINIKTLSAIILLSIVVVISCFYVLL